VTVNWHDYYFNDEVKPFVYTGFLPDYAERPLNRNSLLFNVYCRYYLSIKVLLQLTL